MQDCEYCSNVKFVLTNPQAVIPKKEILSDIGYDLTCISVNKVISKNITRYDTGIAVSPPPGYYMEVVPRSSLSQKGYMLANSIGVIDPSYTGNLLITLIKVDESLPDLKLPFIVCQLIMRPALYFNLKQVEELKTTKRGDGGFGSTDIKK